MSAATWRRIALDALAELERRATTVSSVEDTLRHELHARASEAERADQRELAGMLTPIGSACIDRTLPPALLRTIRGATVDAEVEAHQEWLRQMGMTETGT